MLECRKGACERVMQEYGRRRTLKGGYVHTRDLVLCTYIQYYIQYMHVQYRRCTYMHVPMYRCSSGSLPGRHGRYQHSRVVFRIRVSLLPIPFMSTSLCCRTTLIIIPPCRSHLPPKANLMPLSNYSSGASINTPGPKGTRS